MSKQKLTRILEHRSRVLEQRLRNSRQKAAIRRQAVTDSDNQIANTKKALDLLRQRLVVGKPANPHAFVESREQQAALKETIKGVLTLRAFLSAELKHALKNCQRQAQACVRLDKKREKAKELLCSDKQADQRKKDSAITDDYTLYKGQSQGSDQTGAKT